LVKGQARAIQKVSSHNGTPKLLVARNNDSVLLFRVNDYVQD